MPTFEIVTSFNKRLHASEHQLIVESIERTHPETDFIVYHENSYEASHFGQECDLSWMWGTCNPIDVFQVNPWLEPLVDAWPPLTKGKKSYWNKNARFWVRKVGAWTHAVLNSKKDVVIWLDCDTRLLQRIPTSLLQWTLENKVCSLLRDPIHTETGTMCFAAQAPQARLFATKVRDLYESRAFAELTRWDDCWTFDHIRKSIPVANLTRGSGCPIDIPNELLMHLKDPLKEVRDKEPDRLS